MQPPPDRPGGNAGPRTEPAADKPKWIGFGLGQDVREVAPEGGLLVGLELGTKEEGGRQIVRQARAIYRVGDKEVFGELRGASTGPTVTLKAKAGYAVGAMTVQGGLAVMGLSLTFMKVKDGKLDPSDSHESDWAGAGQNEANAVRLDGGGRPAVGLCGKTDARHLIAIGPVFRGQEAGLGPVPPLGTRHTNILGGAFNPEFQDVAPAGGVLVGLEAGLGKFFNNDVIKSIKPIYRVSEKEESGKQIGNGDGRVVKVVAKPGYAIGAVSIKAGLGLDGFSVTFMKVIGDHLDPLDSYESQYIGGPGGGGPDKLGGDGKFVLGIIGKRSDKEVQGLGLLLKK
jgi:hypothetical protein